jgi:hypothetical protein
MMGKRGVVGVLCLVHLSLKVSLQSCLLVSVTGSWCLTYIVKRNSFDRRVEGFLFLFYLVEDVIWN